MGKYTNQNKLNMQEQNELFLNLVGAIKCAKDLEDAAYILRDLLTPQETLMIARRLRVAYLLSQNLTYSEIAQAMKISQTTIAKIQSWILSYGQGFKLILD